MFTSAIILSFFVTLLICLFVILLKWIIVQVGVTFFAMVLIVMSLVFMIITGVKENGK